MKRNIYINKLTRKVLAASIIGSSVVAGTALSSLVIAYAHDHTLEGYEQGVILNDDECCAQNNLLLDALPNITSVEVSEEAIEINFIRSNASDIEHGRVLHYTIYVNDVAVKNVKYHELETISLTRGEEVELISNTIYTIRVEAVYVPFLYEEVLISGQPIDVLIEDHEEEEVEEEEVEEEEVEEETDEDEDLDIEQHDWLENMPNVTVIEATDEGLTFDFERATESNADHGRVIYHIVHLNDYAVQNINISQTGPITLTEEHGVTLDVDSVYEIKMEAVYVPFLYEEVRVFGNSMSMTIEEDEIIVEIEVEEESTPEPVAVYEYHEIIGANATHNTITFRFTDISLGINHELVDYMVYINDQYAGSIDLNTLNIHSNVNEITVGNNMDINHNLDIGENYNIVVKAVIKNNINNSTFVVESNVYSIRTNPLVDNSPSIFDVSNNGNTTSVEFTIVNTINPDHGRIIGYEIYINGIKEEAVTDTPTADESKRVFHLIMNLLEGVEYTFQVNALYQVTATEEVVTIKGEVFNYPVVPSTLSFTALFEVGDSLEEIEEDDEEDAKEPEDVEEEDAKEPEETDEVEEDAKEPEDVEEEDAKEPEETDEVEEDAKEPEETDETEEDAKEPEEVNETEEINDAKESESLE